MLSLTIGSVWPSRAWAPLPVYLKSLMQVNRLQTTWGFKEAVKGDLGPETDPTAAPDPCWTASTSKSTHLLPAAVTPGPFPKECGHANTSEPAGFCRAGASLIPLRWSLFSACCRSWQCVTPRGHSGLRGEEPHKGPLSNPARPHGPHRFVCQRWTFVWPPNGSCAAEHLPH